MTIKLVIFDCDGVLVDTEPTTHVVISDSLRQHGLAIGPDEAHKLFAGGTMATVGDTARQMGAKLPDSWLDDTYAQIFASLRAGVPVILGVLDLIAKIDAAGMKRAIASNGPVAKMDISLAPSGLSDLFKGRIYSAYEHGPKPKPDMLLKIMSDYGVSPDETVMIDDMAAGCLAAQAAKVRCFGYVADGDPTRIEGTDAQAVTSMAQIATALGLS